MKSKFERKFIAFLSSRLKVEYVKEDPDIVLPGKLYIVGDYGFYWRAILKCPCGCDDSLFLNLDEKTFPCWKIYNKKNIPTIYPSINRLKGCRAHFFLKKGKIIWVN